MIKRGIVLLTFRTGQRALDVVVLCLHSILQTAWHQAKSVAEEAPKNG